MLTSDKAPEAFLNLEWYVRVKWLKFKKITLITKSIKY